MHLSQEAFLEPSLSWKLLGSSLGMATLTTTSVRCENWEFLLRPKTQGLFLCEYLSLFKWINRVCRFIGFQRNFEQNVQQILVHQSVWGFYENQNVFPVMSQWDDDVYCLMFNFKRDLLSNKKWIEILKSLTGFVRPSSPEWMSVVTQRLVK